MELVTKGNESEKITITDGYSHDKHHHKYASKGVAGAALGLGIAGTALWLLNGSGSGSGLFGRLTGSQPVATDPVSAGTTIMGLINSRKECADVLALTNKIWEGAYAAQVNRFNDRQVLNREFFDLYNYTNKGFADAESKRVADAFALYKNARDSKDEVLGEISSLKTELAVMKATRPYQDKIIQLAIDNVAQVADFNLARRTCRMISGEVVLPSTPTVTGYPSYSCCNGSQPAPATT